jgi:hypothetical protein
VVPVDRLGGHDRRDRVVEVHPVAAELAPDHLAERAFGQRAGRDDDVAARQVVESPPLEADPRMERESPRDRACEPEALDRERLPRRHAMRVRGRDDERAAAPELVLEQARRRDGIVAAKRVRAHELAQERRLMRRRHRAGLHLHQRDVDPRLGELPGCLAAGHTAADHGHLRVHQVSVPEVLRFAL